MRGTVSASNFWNGTGWQTTRLTSEGKDWNTAVFILASTLLDMARAMGGHGYDEMWRDNALPGIIGSACTTNKERFFDVT